MVKSMIVHLKYGHVAWYDVMFEHGIEEEVDVNDLTVLISEKH